MTFPRIANMALTFVSGDKGVFSTLGYIEVLQERSFGFNGVKGKGVISLVITYIPGSSGPRRFFRYTMFLIHVIYAISCLYIRSLSVMLSRISFHVLIRQSWSWIHTPRRANGVLSFFLLGDEGLSSGGTKMISIFITAEIGNKSRTINIKPNKGPDLGKKPYPSSPPEQNFASATQQMAQVQKRSSEKQNLSANHKGKHKSINRKEPEQAKQIRLGTIIEMIRGNTRKKRPHEQSKQWSSNEISFPSMSGCQLVDSPIILEALIEGFLVRRIYADGGSSSKRIEEARGPAMEGRITIPRIQAPESEGTTNKGKKERQGQTDKVGELDGIIQPSPIPSKKDTPVDEKDKGKDKPLKKSLKSKPPEKVVIYDDYPDQTIIIGGNLFVECRSKLIEILRKHANAFTWTLADMTGIPCFIAEHKFKTYPHIEPRVQRK
nr:reverse transcriptase domain-containing protein [Tanacetum cinerariifolium]